MKIILIAAIVLGAFGFILSDALDGHNHRKSIFKECIDDGKKEYECVGILGEQYRIASKRWPH